MEKLTYFGISLDQQQGVVFAGQNLSGNVIVDVKKPMETREVALTFRGHAEVSWTESSGTGDDRKTTSYSAEETYFDFKVAVFGGKGGVVTLPAGRNLLPFQYTLPMNIPSSFEGSEGWVRYTLTAKIDRPWKFNEKMEMAFIVVSILDLNIQPEIMTPQQGQKHKTICCLCCKSGPISAVFRIDRRGYVPGECVTLSGEVDNKSNRTIARSKVALRMITEYHADTSTTSSGKDVAKITKGTISPGESTIWSGEQLLIPPLPPSGLVHCNIIDITYLVVLSVHPKGPAIKLEVPLEIVIGTVPLRNLFGRSHDAAMSAPPVVPPEPIQPYQTESNQLPPLPYPGLGHTGVNDKEDDEPQNRPVTLGSIEPVFSVPVSKRSAQTLPLA